MEIHVTCKNCKKRNIVNNPMSCKPRDLEFCSEECNKIYFKRFGRGLVPKAYQHRYRILESSGKAIMIN
jgi:endogenous inhibitor of DNA gyrase (YacG/DUF329 family)